MTDQQSLDDIAMLLMRYPGCSSAVASHSSASDRKVWIRFRCSDLASLKAIASCAVGANVLITVGDPDGSLCGEPEDVTDLPFDVTIEDDRQTKTPPNDAQAFGVFLAWDLKKNGLVDRDTADRLLRRWNAATRDE